MPNSGGGGGAGSVDDKNGKKVNLPSGDAAAVDKKVPSEAGKCGDFLFIIMKNKHIIKIMHR